MACAQAVCLALGLGIQYRFIIESAHWTAASRIATPDQAAVGGESGDLRDAASRALTADDVLQILAMCCVVAFFWIAGLQSMVVYLFWSSAKSERRKTDQQSEHEAMQQVKDLVRTRDAIIFGLAKLAESRDPETGQHLERIALYSTRLASALRGDPRYRGTVTPQFVKSIGLSSALHDIGKVGVEDAILRKQSSLNEAEKQRMRQHTQLGGECIRQIELQLGSCNFLEMAREIAQFHHERWDGSGYPFGLAGQQIPLAARIVAIADVYDALSVRRAYKEPISHDECIEIIRKEAGQHFDAKLVDVFVSIESQFRQIAQKYAETTGAHGTSDSADEHLASDLLELSDECQKATRPQGPRHKPGLRANDN